MADRYYWIKLPKDFFNCHEISALEERGSDYFMFYLKLLTDAVETGGELMYSEDEPFTAETLSAVFKFSEEFVSKAISEFIKLKLIEIDGDGRIFLLKFNSMVGGETKDAERKRRVREMQKTDNVRDCPNLSAICPTEKEKDKEKETDKECVIKKQNTAKNLFDTPTKEDVEQFSREIGSNANANRFWNYYEARGWKLGSVPVADWKALFRTWADSEPTGPPRNFSGYEAADSKHKGQKNVSFDIELAKRASRDRTRDIASMKNPKYSRSEDKT